MLIIPAIDIYENKVVRLRKGNFEDISYYDFTPLEMAKKYEKLGFRLIHIVDLLGSKTGRFTALNSIEQIKEKTKLEVEFGGGVRSINSVEELIFAGVDRVIIGSLAVKNKKEFEQIVDKYSDDKIIVAIDAVSEKVKVSGWTEETGITVSEHINYSMSLGIKRFLCTDISKDGMLKGSNRELYKKLIKEFSSIELIASGGVKDINEIKELNNLGLWGAVVGKAIYEGKINLKELADAL